MADPERILIQGPDASFTVEAETLPGECWEDAVVRVYNAQLGAGQPSRTLVTAVPFPAERGDVQKVLLEYPWDGTGSSAYEIIQVTIRPRS